METINHHVKHALYKFADGMSLNTESTTPDDFQFVDRRAFGL
jgi:hypothetical protein